MICTNLNSSCSDFSYHVSCWRGVCCYFTKYHRYSMVDCFDLENFINSFRYSALRNIINTLLCFSKQQVIIYPVFKFNVHLKLCPLLKQLRSKWMWFSPCGNTIHINPTLHSLHLSLAVGLRGLCKVQSKKTDSPLPAGY